MHTRVKHSTEYLFISTHTGLKELGYECIESIGSNLLWVIQGYCFGFSLECSFESPAHVNKYFVLCLSVVCILL